MLTGGSRESIRPFKAIGSLHAQVPVLSRTRSGNRYAPITLSPTECVFQVSSNVAAQLSVAEILQSSSREVVEDDDVRGAAAKQLVDDMRADEPGASGDDDAAAKKFVRVAHA